MGNFSRKFHSSHQFKTWCLLDYYRNIIAPLRASFLWWGGWHFWGDIHFFGDFVDVQFLADWYVRVGNHCVHIPIKREGTINTVLRHQAPFFLAFNPGSTKETQYSQPFCLYILYSVFLFRYFAFCLGKGI